MGGIFGGFKLCQCPMRLPLVVTVETLSPSAALAEAFQRRVRLVYTGQQRLAHNTLINALRYSALSPAVVSSSSEVPAAAQVVAEAGSIPVSIPEGCAGTVAALVQGALAGWTMLQTSTDNVDDQLDSLSEVLNG